MKGGAWELQAVLPALAQFIKHVNAFRKEISHEKYGF